MESQILKDRGDREHHNLQTLKTFYYDHPISDGMCKIDARGIHLFTIEYALSVKKP